VSRWLALGSCAWLKVSVLRRGVIMGLLGFTLLSGCGGGHVGSPAQRASARDAVVVLGHRPPLDAHGLERETRVRVERGIELYRSGAAPKLLFAGGESTPGVIEADVMAAYAEAQGVPKPALLRERASRDTIENARYTVMLLREALGLDRKPRIVLVTSDYHIARASRLLRCAGAEVVPAPVNLVQTARERRKRRRSERWVGLYYWFIDECERARGE
jgi:uncharacterized SAM-binding protein YcdF (DUF218 family)